MDAKDTAVVLEIARLALAMCFDEIADELDLSDEEMQRLRTLIEGETK